MYPQFFDLIELIVIALVFVWFYGLLRIFFVQFKTIKTNVELLSLLELFVDIVFPNSKVSFYVHAILVFCRFMVVTQSSIDFYFCAVD
jgi:hypothetical protein